MRTPSSEDRPEAEICRPTQQRFLPPARPPRTGGIRRALGLGTAGVVMALLVSSPAVADTPTPPSTTWPGRIVSTAEVSKLLGPATPSTSALSTVSLVAVATVATVATVAISSPASSSAGVSTTGRVSADSGTAGDPGTGTSDDALAKLRKCEAGGRYDLNTGNGFYGAYQFAAKTWTKLGFPGLPHQAQPETQDEAARKLQARAGWGQWPACSRKLGLR